MITSICSEENQNAIDTVNDYKNETLFIIDGLDEVSVKERSLILKTLYELEYSEVTVIVFSRTGLFSLTKDERKDLFKGANKSSNFHDRKISILGIDTNEKKKKFIKNFLPSHDVDKILDSLKPNLKLFDSPLFLMLLTIIVSKKETNIGPFKNRTEIYKMLFNFITRHHLVKCGNDIDTDFDLFEFNSKMNETQSLIQQFGKLSLEKITKNELQFEIYDDLQFESNDLQFESNDLQFESNDLTRQIYNAGFLINHKQMTYFTIENYYEAFHLSFLEFASAYALWIDFKYNKPNLKSLLKPQVLHFFANFKTSLVLVFLASLMQDDVDKFISQIKPFSPYFSYLFYVTVTLFEDCTSINWNEKSNIIDLLPSVIDLQGVERPSNICKPLIAHGSKYGKIKYIIISDRTNPELIPNEISSNSQIIFIKYPITIIPLPTIPLQLIHKLEINNLVQIRYTKGHWNAKDMVTKLKKIVFLSLKEQLTYIASSNTESCILYLDKVDNTQILEIILEIQFKEIKFECLSVKNFDSFPFKNHDDNQLQMITKLIKNNQVENLKLKNSNNDNFIQRFTKPMKKYQVEKLKLITFYFNSNLLNELCVAAGQSTYLTSITVTGCNIDLHHLTNGGTKNYHFIHLDNCALSCSNSIVQKNCCHHLKLTKSYNFEKIVAIIEMEPTSLTCNSDLLGYLFSEYPNWNGFNNIKHLCLCQRRFLMKDVDNIYIDKKLVSWNKLKTLYIDVVSDIDVVRDIDVVIDIDDAAIVKCVQMLDIKNFAIYSNHIRLDNLFKYFNEMEGRLDKIKLIIDVTMTDLYVTELLNGIKCNHWKEVNLLCLYEVSKILSNNSVSQLNDFNVAYFSCGSSEEDVYKLKTQFYPLTLTSGTLIVKL